MAKYEVVQDTELHLSTSFTRERDKKANKFREKTARNFSLVVKGLMISSVLVGSFLGTATKAFAKDSFDPVQYEVPRAYYSQQVESHSSSVEVESYAAVINLRMANKLLQAAVQRGELSISILDSLNSKMEALASRLDSEPHLVSEATKEVSVTDNLLKIENFEGFEESVLLKRNESLEYLSALQQKLGLESTEHVRYEKKPQVQVLSASTQKVAQKQLQYEEVNVTIDGILQKFPQSAILYKGSTMVPMRGVFEALKAEVKWDGATQTVTATKGDTTIKLTIGNNYAYVNDQKVALTAEAIIVNGSTMVPLRFVAESLGAKVEWDGATKTAIISQGSEIKPGSGVTNPAQNQTNPAQNQQDPVHWYEKEEYRYNGIDATETKGRLYGAENQKEYDAVLKIAKEALADLDSIPVPQGMIDVLYNGKSFSPNQRAKTIYEVELMGATQVYKPLLDAGISPDTLVKEYKVAKIVSKITNTTSQEVEETSPGVSSAYDALVEGQIDCDSLANTYALFYDLAGFETGIVREGFHAYIVVKLDGQWTRGGKVLDLPSYFKEYKLSWYTRPDSIDWDSYRDAK
jgi:hypothetical protein